MRILPDLCRTIASLYLLCATVAAFGFGPAPTGQFLWVRLTAPLSTYTAKSGDPVHAVLTQDLVSDHHVVLPMGTQIEGTVRSKRKVGWGIRHETAALELEFHRAILAPGVETSFTARVEEVENARESVRNGIIQGIRSTRTFQGSINSRLIHLPTWNPYSDPVLIAFKTVFPIFPEPEIHYPPGTDLRLRTTTELSVPISSSSDASESALPVEPEPDPMTLDHLGESIPSRVTTQKNADADLVNIIFRGSKEEIDTAFRRAGWKNADPSSRRAWMKTLYALLNNSGYDRQPMMTFLLDGKAQDMSWQKSLNSYNRRDHLRIWQWAPNGAHDVVWLSASTHDTDAALHFKSKGFVHHIAPDIDDERSTVIRDLNFAGCVESVRYITNRQIPTLTRNATGDPMRTDGSVAIVTLQRCESALPQPELRKTDLHYKPGNPVFRFCRRQILTFKNDIARANLIYGAYDGSRMLVTSLRRRPEIPPTTQKPIELAHRGGRETPLSTGATDPSSLERFTPSEAPASAQ